MLRLMVFSALFYPLQQCPLWRYAGRPCCRIFNPAKGDTMQTTPEAGKTYTSSIDPSLTVSIISVLPSEIDPLDNVETGFFVECSHPGDENDMQAIGYDFTRDEWEAHQFIPCKTSIK